MWLDTYFKQKGMERLSERRVKEAIATGADVLAVSCPYEIFRFEDALKMSRTTNPWWCGTWWNCWPNHWESDYDRLPKKHEPVRIGFYVCHCGTNIAGMVDVEAVAKYAATLPNVVVSRNYKYMCSDPGQELIQQDIRENRLNRIVVAACSPLLHEHTFRKATDEGRPQPVLLPDGEHPRAQRLGAHRPRRGDAQGAWPWRAPPSSACRCTSRWRSRRSRSTPTCSSSAAASPASTPR